MNTRLSVLFFCFALMGLYSCKNNDEVFKPVQYTYLNVVNATVDTLNFYLNGTRQNNTSSLYPTGQSLYLTVPSGAQKFEFKKAGTSNVLFEIPLNLKDSTYNSLYVYGEGASQTFITNDILLTYTSHPDTTQVKFVNVSPDAGNLDMTVGNTVSFKSLPLKSSTEYVEMPGVLTEVKVFQSGSATPLKDTSIQFQPGGIYTLFSKGLLNGKGNAAFGIGVVINH
jgi:Domain of unknown function (DUF4397)